MLVRKPYTSGCQTEAMVDSGERAVELRDYLEHPSAPMARRAHHRPNGTCARLDRHLGNAQEVHRHHSVVHCSAGDSVTDLAQGSNFAEKQMSSYAEVATSPRVLAPVIGQLGLRTTPKELSESVEVTVPVKTVILEISATDGTLLEPRRSPTRSAKSWRRRPVTCRLRRKTAPKRCSADHISKRRKCRTRRHRPRSCKISA